MVSKMKDTNIKKQILLYRCYPSISCLISVVVCLDYQTINPFVPNAPFLYPLKTSENLTVFKV